MPELPDVTVYVEALRPRVVGRVLEGVRIRGPALLRTFEPSVESAEGRRVGGVERLAKRIVVGLEGDLFLVLHLMIAGRLLWKEGRHTAKGKTDQAAFVFAPPGSARAPEASTLMLTEAGTRRRAALHVVRGREALSALHPGGLEPLECTDGQFAAAMTRNNRTLKRALTDQRILAGVGNAYSDEILFEAGLSPARLTRSLTPREVERLHLATRDVLVRWTARLRREFGLPPAEGHRPANAPLSGAGRFPGRGEITAFRPDFRVHGKFGRPCVRCGTPVQRIVHADNETNYCPTCQNGGRLLADRSLSRLLKDDRPRTAGELEGGSGEG